MDVLKAQLIRPLLLGFVTLSTTGCLATYLVRSGYGQMKILSEREPIEKALEKKGLPDDQRRKLELALRVRDFAEKKLHLKPTNNYKTFVDIKRPYVTYIVTVAEKWLLEPRLYWYPIVGRLPYKGFFTKEEAEEEAKKFDPDRYDVMVRGVSAYSTLGWFDDPLLSTMLNGSDHHMVNLIIHESTHATLYFSGQADFNERLATYMGQLGTRIFYRELEGADSQTISNIEKENEDEKLFSQFISDEVKSLKSWYVERRKLNTPAQEEERKKRLAEIQSRFARDIQPKLQTKSYTWFTDLSLNNASLLHFNTYVTDLSDFDQLYRSLGQDFSQFLKFCKNLEKSSDPHQKLKDHLSSLAVNSSSE